MIVSKKELTIVQPADAICYTLTISLSVRPCEQQESVGGLGSGSQMMPVGLILTQRRVQGQGLGFSPSASEGIFPKKSLQWTIGLVNRG